MSYTAFFLIIAVSTAAAVAFSYAVHKFVHVDTRRRHQDVGSALFLQLGVLFAMLLAFVFNEAYAEYDEAQRAIDLECSALHSAAMIESTLPAAQAVSLLRLETAYIKAVLRYEWPEMRADRHGSPRTVATMTELVQRAASLPTPSAADAPLKAQLLDLLSTAQTQREVRLYQARNGLPPVLWGVMIVFSVLLMVFVTLSGIESYQWLVMFVITFSICVSAILAFVGLVNYPFQGALALPPDDFAVRLAQIQALLNTVAAP